MGHKLDTLASSGRACQHMSDFVNLTECVEAPSVAGEFGLRTFTRQSHLSKGRIRYFH